MKKHASVAILASLSLTALALSGCSGAGDSSAPVGADETQLFTQTVVHLKADGTQTQTVAHLTAAQLDAQTQARALHKRYDLPVAAPASVTADGIGSTAQAIAVETCQYDSVELWDGPNGTGNSICFTGMGSAYLPNYVRGFCRPSGCSHWDDAVRSYWGSSGDTLGDVDWSTGEDGYFIGGAPSDVICKEYFSSRKTSLTNAGSCAVTAFVLTLTD